MKTKNRKKRFTLHDIALQLIASKVKGVISHYKYVFLDGLIPDIITDDSVHEVTAIDIRTKINKYRAEKSIYKHILWLALPMGTSTVFDEINFVEVNHKGFKNIHIKREKLDPILLPSPPFSLIKGKPQDNILNVLYDVEQKLRQNRFIKEANTFKFVIEKLWLTYIK